MTTMATVIVEAPKALPVETQMAVREWASYRTIVWARRADAKAQKRYLGRIKRWVTAVARVVQWGIALTSGAAFVQAVSDGPTAGIVACTLASAVLSATAQVFDLAGIVQSYAALVEAWAGRELFWDEVWLITEGGRYPGPVSDLARPEVELARQQAALSVPSITSWKTAAMNEVEASDPLMSAA